MVFYLSYIYFIYVHSRYTTVLLDIKVITHQLFNAILLNIINPILSKSEVQIESYVKIHKRFCYNILMTTQKKYKINQN